MKLIFFFLFELLFFSCNSNVKENHITDKKVEQKIDSVETLGERQIRYNHKLDDIKQNIKQESIVSVNVANKIILVTIENSFNAPIFYDAKIVFEKWDYNKWKKMEYVKTYGIPNIEYILQPSDKRSHSIFFNSFLEQPTKGKYRLIKGYYFENKIKKEEIKEFIIN